MDLVDHLKLERRKLGACAAAIEENLGPQFGLGWNDCASLDRRRCESALHEFSAILASIERLERRFAWPLPRGLPENRRRARELEEAERSLEEWARLLKCIVACSDCVHVHAVRSALRGLEAQLKLYVELAEGAAACV